MCFYVYVSVYVLSNSINLNREYQFLDYEYFDCIYCIKKCNMGVYWTTPVTMISTRSAIYLQDDHEDDLHKSVFVLCYWNNR